ncbi:DUF6153 family protein [Marinitenerispora sediminis]|uniref:Uncharacterized protein n=1 Tax=Marinitenerispora sediminis TaxID=1931232 RepID=A0A368T443_9ACTN|nr:DUF6153 family protein [Marinitenerispora sediminis]RCV55861.1 hypothetical protein DEF28_04710 [Marinitenerispora sediminis]RCV57324.1 hypothetical protein DEF24_15335 [Marinitenerispora sediminis]RCV59412.1 hypothetical protein DEF23_07600 [Marinitenerispora sediminis]
MFSVRRRRRTAPWTWARALLLLCVLTGVAGMHTLGHPHPEEHRAAAAVSVPAADHAEPSTARTAMDGPDSGSDSPPPMDPTAVCLAVGGLVLALLGVAAAALPRWPGTAARARARVRRRPAPDESPPRPPSLSRLQVLRI